ncbi:MAG TPA: hypothetical protein VMA77_25610 [Solirubrobacteraceae bacterium]|nr:hypothetical protein [Solirubrobacteraceae bacterium]
MTRVLATLAVASVTAVLAGCGGSSAASSSATVTATATPAAVTSTASASPVGGRPAGGSSGLAAPGAAFAAGQSATVPYQLTESNGANGPTYKLSITVESIERGTLADFNGIQLDADQKASTPYYVRVRMKNLGPGTLNTSDNDPAGQIQGVDKTGQPQDSVTFLLGTFPRCPDTDTPNPFKPRQSFSTCLTFLVPGGITKVAYTGPPQSYYDSPVTWEAK